MKNINANKAFQCSLHKSISICTLIAFSAMPFTLMGANTTVNISNETYEGDVYGLKNDDIGSNKVYVTIDNSTVNGDVYTAYASKSTTNGSHTLTITGDDYEGNTPSTAINGDVYGFTDGSTMSHALAVTISNSLVDGDVYVLKGDTDDVADSTTSARSGSLAINTGSIITGDIYLASGNVKTTAAASSITVNGGTVEGSIYGAYDSATIYSSISINLESGSLGGNVYALGQYASVIGGGNATVSLTNGFELASTSMIYGSDNTMETVGNRILSLVGYDTYDDYSTIKKSVANFDFLQLTGEASFSGYNLIEDGYTGIWVYNGASYTYMDDTVVNISNETRYGSPSLFYVNSSGEIYLGNLTVNVDDSTFIEKFYVLNSSNTNSNSTLSLTGDLVLNLTDSTFEDGLRPLNNAAKVYEVKDEGGEGTGVGGNLIINIDGGSYAGTIQLGSVYGWLENKAVVNVVGSVDFAEGSTIYGEKAEDARHVNIGTDNKAYEGDFAANINFSTYESSNDNPVDTLTIHSNSTVNMSGTLTSIEDITVNGKMTLSGTMVGDSDYDSELTIAEGASFNVVLTDNNIDQTVMSNTIITGTDLLNVSFENDSDDSLINMSSILGTTTTIYDTDSDNNANLSINLTTSSYLKEYASVEDNKVVVDSTISVQQGDSTVSFTKKDDSTIEVDIENADYSLADGDYQTIDSISSTSEYSLVLDGGTLNTTSDITLLADESSVSGIKLNSGNIIANTITLSEGTISLAEGTSTTLDSSKTVVSSTTEISGTNSSLSVSNLSVESEATLKINTDLAISGTENIISGTLSGDGTITGSGIDSTLTFTGTYAPGNSPTSTTISNVSVVFDTGSSLEMEIFGTAGAGVDGGYDQLNFGASDTTTSVTFNGTVDLIVSDISSWTGGTELEDGSVAYTFELFTFTDDIQFSTEDYLTIVLSNEDTSYNVELGNEYTLGEDGEYLIALDGFNGSITLTVAVPEPSTYAMIFGALALGLAMYRRRK